MHVAARSLIYQLITQARTHTHMSVDWRFTPSQKLKRSGINEAHVHRNKTQVVISKWNYFITATTTIIIIIRNHVEMMSGWNCFSGARLKVNHWFHAQFLAAAAATINNIQTVFTHHPANGSTRTHTHTHTPVVAQSPQGLMSCLSKHWRAD